MLTLILNAIGIVIVLAFQIHQTESAALLID